MLIQELLDIPGRFGLERRLDFVPFFFADGEESARVISTVAAMNCSASFSNFLRPAMAAPGRRPVLKGLGEWHSDRFPRLGV